MKKSLRFAGALIAIIIITIIILSLVEPNEVVVTRNITIKAPKEKVFKQIQYFKNWTNWSPWEKMDSGKMKMTYNGTDGTEGSSYHWEGSDRTGAGDMKNMGITGTVMNYEVDILKPHSFSSQGIIKAADTAGMTKVTWNCSVKMSFPWNAAFLIINFDKMLGPDFDGALVNMKKYVENNINTITQADIEIKEVDYPEHIFEGIRKTVGWADIGKLFAEANPILNKDASDKINGPSTGLFFIWDTATKTTDAVAAFPVSDSATPVKGASFFVVPAAKAYMAVQKGGYSTSMQYHEALNKYMIAKGQTYSVVIEEYEVTQYQQPDSNKWVTNIYYIVK